MQFQIPHAMLNGALGKIYTALENKSSQAVEGHLNIRIDAYGKWVRLAATGKVMHAEAHLTGIETTVPSAFGVSGRLFRDLVASFPEDSIIGFELGDSKVAITAAGSSYKLPVLSPDFFPPRDGYDTLNLVKANIKTFISQLSQVNYCTVKDGVKEYASGVCIQPDEFVATDGFRMAICPNDGVPIAGPVMVPGDGVDRLASIYRGLGEEGSMLITPTQLHVAAGGILSTTRLLNARFPAYKSIIPTGGFLSCSLQAPMLISALNRLLLVSEGTLPVVTLAVTPNTLTLTTRADAGMSKEVVPCVGVGSSPVAEIRLNGAFIREAASNLSNKDIVIQLRSPDEPVVFTDGKNLNFVNPMA